jgi:hypothetical protein
VLERHSFRPNLLSTVCQTLAPRGVQSNAPNRCARNARPLWREPAKPCRGRGRYDRYSRQVHLRTRLARIPDSQVLAPSLIL